MSANSIGRCERRGDGIMTLLRNDEHGNLTIVIEQTIGQ